MLLTFILEGDIGISFDDEYLFKDYALKYEVTDLVDVNNVVVGYHRNVQLQATGSNTFELVERGDQELVNLVQKYLQNLYYEGYQVLSNQELDFITSYEGVNIVWNTYDYVVDNKWFALETTDVSIDATITSNDVSVSTTLNIEVLQSLSDNIGDKLVYETGFEKNEGYVAGTTYNNVTEELHGPNGFKLGVISGTPSTNNKINGSQSLQLRYYESNPTLFGSVVNKVAVSNLSRIQFLAQYTMIDYNVKVQFSTDGLNWKNGEVFKLEFEENTHIDVTNTLVGAKYFKLSINDEKALINKKGIIIDGLKVYQSVELIRPINVSFDHGYEGSMTEIVKVEKGGVVLLPKVPTREGYIFLGWFIKDTNIEFDLSTLINEEVELIAKWEIFVETPEV